MSKQPLNRNGKYAKATKVIHSTTTMKIPQIALLKFPFLAVCSTLLYSQFPSTLCTKAPLTTQTYLE